MDVMGQCDVLWAVETPKISLDCILYANLYTANPCYVTNNSLITKCFSKCSSKACFVGCG